MLGSVQWQHGGEEEPDGRGLDDDDALRVVAYPTGAGQRRELPGLIWVDALDSPSLTYLLRRALIWKSGFGGGDEPNAKQSGQQLD